MSLTALVALLVCLIPTTIGGLLSAVGVAGMSRMMQANVIATSGRAVEAAGDVDVLLLDKTGTITHGNRQASAFLTAPGVSQAKLARAALLASLPDETPEGRSIVELARRGGIDGKGVDIAHFVPFTAQTSMSGVNLPAAPTSLDADPIALRKGAVDAVRRHVEALGGSMAPEVLHAADAMARRGSTPLAVAEGSRVLGIVELKDIVKTDIKEARAQRGKLRIYFGANAGVGKTWAMLSAAQRRSAPLSAAQREHTAGRDVVIGVVETHGRSETAVLLAGLERHAVRHARPGSRPAGGTFRTRCAGLPAPAAAWTAPRRRWWSACSARTRTRTA